MAKIDLYQDEKLIQTLNLLEGHSYYIGRADNCDLILPSEKGISRKHLELSPEGRSWRMKVISRYEELYQNGEKVPELLLDGYVVFDVPPFRMIFQSGETAAKSENSPEPTKIIGPDATTHAESPLVELEKTAFYKLDLVGILKLFNDKGRVTRVFRLDGSKWIGGREDDCQIFLQDAKVSRKHFEIQKNENLYLLRDLGSANGTKLNAQPVSAQVWSPLNNEDLIQIMDLTMQFELVNPLSFNENDVIETEPAPLKKVGSRPDKKKSFRLVLLGIIILGGALSVLFNDDPPPKAKPVNPSNLSKEAVAFAKLSPAQQEYVRDCFQMSKKLYMDGRYQMAEQELIKIHQLVPAYEDSEELARNVQAGLDMVRQRDRQEEEDKQKAEQEQKIKNIVENCGKKINPSMESEEMDACLSDAKALNPNDPEIEALMAKVNKLVEDRKIKAAQQTEYHERILHLQGRGPFGDF